MTVEVDLDFQRYIERRKGALEAQSREGAAYAYAGDLRVKKTVDSLRPVRLAIDATVRMWKSVARTELLGAAVKVSPQQHPHIDALADQAAKALHITRPTVYVTSELGPFAAYTFGTDEDAYIVLSERVVGSLSESELLFVLGAECGHIQNEHVVLMTSLYYLQHAANRFLKWIVTPAAAALRSWSRRAEITADRAGLIAARNLDTIEVIIPKLGAPKLDDVRVQQRIECLRIFGESAYYKSLTGGHGGLTQAEVDGKVGEVLSR